MTWSHIEQGILYRIPGNYMQIFALDAFSSQYELKNIVSMREAHRIYPDIIELYHMHMQTCIYTHQTRDKHSDLLIKLNKLHINREPLGAEKHTTK